MYRKAAKSGHCVEAVDWIECTDEHSAWLSFQMTGDVKAVIHAVDEVDVYVSRWAEQDGVGGSQAAGGVGCGIGWTEVGFDLDDAAGEALAVEIADEELAEEGSGYDLGSAGVERSCEELGVTGLWGCAHIFCADFFANFLAMVKCVLLGVFEKTCRCCGVLVVN
jgi:hypothetical protein